MTPTDPGVPEREDERGSNPRRVGPDPGSIHTTSHDPDLRWMNRALELATRGRCGASPNPMVGAVITDAEGKLAGEGYHAAFGGPHAEIVALADAGERARGGTLYVTLEPCSHHGKTPPCVDSILAAGLERVVIALTEPTTLAGGGADRLRTEGVEVREGPGAEHSRSLNRRWLHWARFHRPWVTMKAAVSLDGRVATREGHSKWITGEGARNRSLELREEHDAILVGVETILADDPRLTRRLGLNPVQGWRRIVLDSKLRTPSEAEVVKNRPEITLIYHTTEATAEDRRRLREAGVELIELRAGDDGRVDLEALLDHLARREVAALLVEGGPTVHGSFNDAELVDEVALFVAPFIIGGKGPSAVAGRGIASLEAANRLVFEDIDRHGEDLEIRAVRPEEADVHGAD
ncbi:MAG: bifunctional diaminohydroxyphosphoribosylaminopyrimidine deaminase/5-amino-6-(5-phosphoribosylamino)uracil reductase RibD [Holophagae bacterium]